MPVFNTPYAMKLEILIVSVFYLFAFCELPAQNDDFYKERIVKAPERVFDMFMDAEMNPSNHVLTEAEQTEVDKAFLLLPPLHKKILKDHLQSISFMDNMPNTALTSTLETTDSTQQFNITFRAGILHETISAWATWKENSYYKVTDSPSLAVQIEAGSLNAFVYVLLHEATHVVDAVLQLTPDAEENDSLVNHTVLTKNVWRLFNQPTVKYTNSILEKSRFRSGKVQPISSATDIYHALKKTPFASLYGMASWYEDAAELITIFHLTNKLKQPFTLYLKDNDEVLATFEPMKNKLVKRRLRKLDFLYY